MHELALAESVVRIVSQHADGRQVVRVNLKIGHLRQVVPSALAFSFELVAQGTPVEGAQLGIEEIPATGRCRACGAKSRLDTFPLQCRECAGFDLELTAGEELYVESLELEEQIRDREPTG